MLQAVVNAFDNGPGASGPVVKIFRILTKLRNG